MSPRRRPDTTSTTPLSETGGGDQLVARSAGPARALSDPADLKALTHPTRLALLEVLSVKGPLTATEAAGFVGASPSSCSFHLRQLAKRGFVEETGGGHGRQRPWRMVTLGNSVQPTEIDAAIAPLAETLTDLWQDRALGRLRHWLATRRGASRPVRSASTFNSNMAWATPAEMRKLNEDVAAVMDRFRARAHEPGLRPKAALAFETLYFSYPVPDRLDQPPGPDHPPPD